MEIRTNTHGMNKLSTKTFVSDDKQGFLVASVIIMGKKECVLVDAQWSIANGHRVVAEIIESGLELKAIYVTHAHPDHYFGLEPIVDAFPNAKILAIPIVCQYVAEQFKDKTTHWEDIIGKNNVPTRAIPVEPLLEDHIMLEGERIEIIPRMMGDMRYNTVVWIPSIKTLIAADVMEMYTHLFICEITKEDRAQWIKDIEYLETLGAEVVIPGHAKLGAPWDDSVFDYCKTYLQVAEEQLAKTDSAAEYFLTMCQLYPDSVLITLSNEMNAMVLKGGREWQLWNED